MVQRKVIGIYSTYGSITEMLKIFDLKTSFMKSGWFSRLLKELLQYNCHQILDILITRIHSVSEGIFCYIFFF